MRGSVSLGMLFLSACAGRAAPPPAVSSASPAASASASAPATAPSATPAPTVLSPGLVLIGEVVGPPGFDPKPALTGLKPAFLRCYNEARLLTPTLHGKLGLQIQVSESGLVTLVTAAPGGQASDPGMLACIGDATKAVGFPKPGGNATINVPLVFKP